MDEELKEALGILKKLSFPEKGGKHSDNGVYTTFKMEKGECKCWTLYPGENLSVHKWYNSAGCIFQGHQHKEKEWIFIERGEMHLKKNGKVEILKEGDMVFNEPSEAHSATFPVATVYITIMIPPCEDYPDG